MPPLIGIAAHQKLVEEEGYRVVHHVAGSAYVRAVRKAGGLPVLLPLVEPEDAGGLLERVDGIVLTGGDDIDPSFYGAEAHPRLGPTDRLRDELELALCRLAVERDVPTLAVCRGCQVLTVALGGGLVQHIEDHFQLDRYNESVHQVTVEPDSTLAHWLGTTGLGVNSLHHQAAATVEGVGRVVARAEDGTIEAVEPYRTTRVVGVQWHPELLRHRPEHMALFAGLVGTAERAAAR
ncbi:MAG TPA: gamma-glutamyl-gamma-aminobutyrate hydrolase family protein [Acidimicrobiales bacterium]|nr:gamma-glutamyl-gamma-aminobutyrate hydrolase family protein [Acidimicrobiales bacterium]